MLTDPEENIPQPQQPPHSELKPMLAPGSGQAVAGTAKSNIFGLVTIVILAAGMAASMVFKGDSNKTLPVPPPPAPIAVSVENTPAVSSPDMPAALAARVLAEGSAVLAQAQTPSSSPRPFFGSDYSPAPNQALQLVPLNSALAAAAPCTTPACQLNSLTSSPSGSFTKGTDGVRERRITMTFMGMCENQFVYKFNNISRETMYIFVNNKSGQQWTFKLPSGANQSIKSLTQYKSDSFNTGFLSEPELAAYGKSKGL